MHLENVWCISRTRSRECRREWPEAAVPSGKLMNQQTGSVALHIAEKKQWSTATISEEITTEQLNDAITEYLPWNKLHTSEQEPNFLVKWNQRTHTGSLSEESQQLAGFNSSFGWFYFIKMLFGLIMNQDVFQQKMDQILENCRWSPIRITDDVIVFGKKLGWAQHVAKEKGFIFNSFKCSIKTRSIKFFGAVYDENVCSQTQRK